MRNDLKTTGNRLQKTLVPELRNQSREIPFTQVTRTVLHANISAAC